MVPNLARISLKYLSPIYENRIRTIKERYGFAQNTVS
jgi:hypothetical protein